MIVLKIEVQESGHDLGFPVSVSGFESMHMQHNVSRLASHIATTANHGS